VQEARNYSKEKGEPGFIIKLDMANAFDQVRHSFLFIILKTLGFSSDFINWIKACFGSPWIALLINGRPTSFFNASRGIYQCFSLSPLLYLIVLESFSRNLKNYRASVILIGVCIAINVKDINHYQFTDDAMFWVDLQKYLQVTSKKYWMSIKIF